ncbi:angiogenic factor with G patch and FHA domains 1 isoform X2 [Neocloeon triangulifer]|uniref:angiogenic factor with G patch and FHA domains 1 isoform X2 n=1 Tax=Neocloeon triangulifer TaxID=2078957 RepID=UPI00286EED24|nr:angiogenic factor with G patch and FHA domains 1 isoform X2 [Neocloeon triangulifer]
MLLRQVTEKSPEREGAKTPEMKVEAKLLNPDLAEFDVPEHVLEQIGDLPQVQEYIVDLNRTIRSFKTATAALQQLQSGGNSNESRGVFMPKKKKKVELTSAAGDESWVTGLSIADQVKEIAENVVQETGFVYHESLGLYYDNSTGYYYDQNTGLYYDGVNKTYYTYDENTGVFSVYHQQEDKDPEEERREHWEQELERKKRELLLEVKKKNAKRKKEQKIEEEEGECSSDSEVDSYDYYKKKKSAKEKSRPVHHKLPTADEIDPCMRLIVQQTDLEKLKLGTLFIVTCTGGTLGREGSHHSVTVPDLNVSKSHCNFLYEDGGYWVEDSGSTNGTWLNKKRLKKDKTKQVMHGSIIRVANTFLLCHIHPGQETCGHCEPGLVQQPEAVSSSTLGEKPTHKEELLRLKRRFALSGVGEADTSLASGYVDRADRRRVTVGSQHHGEKTEAASLDAAVPQSNKGFKMLEKMGWKSGETLGKDGVSGIAEPINIDLRADKTGLGLDSIPLPPEMDRKDKRRKQAWDKARDRFQNIPTPPS